MPKAKMTLSQEVKSLKAENARLKRQLDSNNNRQGRNGWRTSAIVIMAGLSGAILLSANLLFWTARTLVETDRYTDATKALIEKPAVQKAIADKTTEAIFLKIDTTQLLQETLPPRVQFVAPTLAAQIETFTNEKANQAVSSEKFQSVWVDTNRAAHERFIDAVRNYEGDGTINLSDVYKKLVQRLQDTKLSFLQNVQLPSDIGSIQIIDAPWLKLAHWLVVNLDMLRAVTISLFLILTTSVIALARQRRKAALRIGFLYALLMFITLIAVRIVRAISVGQVEPQYQQAATEAYQAVLSPFVLQTTGLLALSLVIVAIAWIIGPGKNATKLRRSFNTLFENNVHGAIFGKNENAYTGWVGRHKATLQWAAVALAFVSLLVVSITVANIVWILLGLLAVIAIIQISSARK